MSEWGVGLDRAVIWRAWQLTQDDAILPQKGVGGSGFGGRFGAWQWQLRAVLEAALSSTRDCQTLSPDALPFFTSVSTGLTPRRSVFRRRSVLRHGVRGHPSSGCPRFG